jgi:hypothetical protein
LYGKAHCEMNIRMKGGDKGIRKSLQGTEVLYE